MSEMDLNVSREAVTLRMRVEDKLRSAIASGIFKPGQRLIERELCELTGVGRTSIREAVRQLEAEGLITSVPHRGPWWRESPSTKQNNFMLCAHCSKVLPAARLRKGARRTCWRKCLRR